MTPTERKIRKSVVTRPNGNKRHPCPWTVMGRVPDKEGGGWELLHLDVNRESCYRFAEEERARRLRRIGQSPDTNS